MLWLLCSVVASLWDRGLFNMKTWEAGSLTEDKGEIKGKKLPENTSCRSCWYGSCWYGPPHPRKLFFFFFLAHSWKGVILWDLPLPPALTQTHLGTEVTMV